MQNLLLETPQYKIEETATGVWKRFLYPSGQSYAEFTSAKCLFGLPMVHYTSGICPETGRRRTARGIFAIGRVAVGFLALGQAAFGAIAIGQAAFGVVLGIGQLAIGLSALGQLCFGGIAVGQIAIGIMAAGQLGIGLYTLAQQGLGQHLLDARHSDPAIAQFLQRFWPRR